MLLLTSTSDKLQIITSAAVNVDVHASYVDYNGTTVTPGRLNSKISTATTTDVVGAPGSGTQRNVKTLHVHNIHASSSVIVTIQHTDGTNVIKLEEVTLLAAERVSYVEGQGFRVFDVNGVAKENSAAAVFVKALASDQSNSTTTPTNVTGLETPCGVGVWIFEYYLVYRAAATTTGVKFSANHDGTVTTFVYWWRWVDVSATASTAVPTQAAVGAAGQVMGAMAARAKTTGGTGVTLSVDVADADMMAVLEGVAVVTVAGNIELWHGSEVAAASTVRAGSGLRLTRLG
jgi:hypothetical protein